MPSIHGTSEAPTNYSREEASPAWQERGSALLLPAAASSCFGQGGGGGGRAKGFSLKITFATETRTRKVMHGFVSDAAADADGCRAGLAMGLPGWRGWEMLGGAGSELVFPRKVALSRLWGGDMVTAMGQCAAKDEALAKGVFFLSFLSLPMEKLFSPMGNVRAHTAPGLLQGCYGPWDGGQWQ